MSKENEEIKELIKKSGMTVRRIAKITSIPDGRIYGWTNKNARPSLEDLMIIRRLVNGENNQSQEPKTDSASIALLSVVASKVAELLSEKSGRSSLIEYELMKKEASTLEKMKFEK